MAGGFANCFTGIAVLSVAVVGERSAALSQQYCYRHDNLSRLSYIAADSPTLRPGRRLIRAHAGADRVPGSPVDVLPELDRTILVVTYDPLHGQQCCAARLIEETCF
jgi:hypothetical protein